MKSRGYKDVSGLRKAPSALTVVIELNKLHKGRKSAGVWLLYLAYRAELIDEFWSPGHRINSQVRPRSIANLGTLFRIIESEIQPEPVLTEPKAEPARIRPNKLSPRDGEQSHGSLITEQAARAVHQTTWRVNTYMLGVLDKCGLPDMKAKERELEQVRAERDSLFASRKDLLEQAEDDPDAAAAADREYSDAKAARQYVRSLESELAEHAANEQNLAAAWARARFPEFYIPVRFDYRGRLFQIDSQLQYTGGSDLARGLLEFARGRRLSELNESERKVASMFLKIQMANCWGIRGPHSRRIKWPRKNFENIGRSVTDPANFDWWRKAKKPYQFLAAAHAWVEATDNDGAIHIPCTLDATNSGLQHCCLLLRDQKLAPFVNLVDSTKPQDFYTAISESTGLNDREITKRIIVPMIYGSAPSNTASILAGKDKPFTKDHYQRAVSIREAVWAEIPEVKALYERLAKIARITAKANRALTWTTPSGFTVAQDSRESKSRPAIDVRLPTGRFQAWERYPGEKLDRNKQAQSFAANFVHSFDASLLSLMIVSGSDSIRDWACAHDSIGVPAWHGFELLALAGDRMQDMHEPDNLSAAWAGWRELGVNLPDAPGTRGDGLPRPINARSFYLWM